MVRRRGFTLIELLVVIAVIGLLVAIMMPALGKVRTSSRRAVCASNLKQIGVLMQLYLGEHNDRLPYASFMPSIGPFPLDREKPIHIAYVLRRNPTDPTNEYECPADLPGGARPDPNNGKSYFDSEKSSYEYRVRLAGQTTKEVAGFFERFTDRAVAENTIWIMRDYDNFHGPALASEAANNPDAISKSGSRRYLYVDGHVADFEN